MKRLLLSAFIFLAAIQSALAIDPGTVQGSLQVNATTIPLKQVYAHMHDNAEGLLDRPKELRILLTDREVPPGALAGIAFLPVEDLARQGQVQGLLLKLNPDKPDNITATLLFKPAQPGMSLMTQTLAMTGQKVFKEFGVANQRVTGAIEQRDARAGTAEMPSLAYAAKFSAPLFNEPAVTADLKGKDAQGSAQVRALLARARAFGSGDFATVRKFSTERSYRNVDQMLKQLGANAAAMAKDAGKDMEGGLAKVQRVVVRGDRAVAISGKKDSWFTLAQEGGEWKSDD
jgi:hypothetical protein